jgi:hypothetical protein
MPDTFPRFASWPEISIAWIMDAHAIEISPSHIGKLAHWLTPIPTPMNVNAAWECRLSIGSGRLYPQAAEEKGQLSTMK